MEPERKMEGPHILWLPPRNCKTVLNRFGGLICWKILLQRNANSFAIINAVVITKLYFSQIPRWKTICKINSKDFFFLLAICANWKESQHPPLDFPKISTENPIFFCLVPLADGIWVPVLKRIAGQGWGGGGMDLTPLMNKVNLTLISGRNKIPINCQVLEGFTTTHTSSCCWQESESNTPHRITPRTHFLGTGKTPFTLTIKCAVNEASRLTLHVTDVSVRACMLSHFRHVRLSVTP